MIPCATCSCGTLNEHRVQNVVFLKGGEGAGVPVPPESHSLFSTMKDTHFFEIVCLVDNTVVYHIMEAHTSRDAKYQVEQHWREHQMYDNRVIKVVPSTYNDWVAYQQVF